MNPTDDRIETLADDILFYAANVDRTERRIATARKYEPETVPQLAAQLRFYRRHYDASRTAYRTAVAEAESRTASTD